MGSVASLAIGTVSIASCNTETGKEKMQLKNKLPVPMILYSMKLLSMNCRKK